MLRQTCERAEIDRWDACAGTRLRLGLADAVDRRAVSRLSDHRRVQLRESTQIHRESSPGNGADERPRDHRRHAGVRDDARRSIESCRSRCSNTCETTSCCFAACRNWLTPDGKAFVHVFCHRDTPYLFETEGAANWMGRHFFTGGMMPSEDLFSHFADDLAIERQWRVSGLHYWRTCEAWLRNLDRNRAAILDCFRDDLPDREAKLSLQRWRIFFMACAELFRYRGGDEWFVAHYLFQHARTKSPRPLSNAQSLPSAR